MSQKIKAQANSTQKKQKIKKRKEKKKIFHKNLYSHFSGAKMITSTFFLSLQHRNLTDFARF